MNCRCGSCLEDVHIHDSVVAGPIDTMPQSIGSILQVALRAICPWRWEANYDPLRVPALVYEARCSCDRRSAVYSYECEPILMRIKVPSVFRLSFSSQSCTTVQFPPPSLPFESHIEISTKIRILFFAVFSRPI